MQQHKIQPGINKGNCMYVSRFIKGRNCCLVLHYPEATFIIPLRFQYFPNESIFPRFFTKQDSTDEFLLTTAALTAEIDRCTRYELIAHNSFCSLRIYRQKHS